ncbi:MAG: type IV secretion system protein VirD4 [Alphaproteobacteria bacterium]|jgi:type IV secretion system protein VirD4
MRKKIFFILSLIIAASVPFIAPSNLIIETAVVLFIGLGFVYYKTLPKEGYKRQVGDIMKMTGKASKAHGSAEFAKMKDLKEAGLIRENGFLLGKFENKFLRFRIPGHLITFAPTRSGKGVGHVIPNLLDHPGSVVVNDIKGENYAVTGRHRAKFSKVINFAPFLEGSGCYNPIDFIRVGTNDELDDASLISDMIIVPQGSDEFWTNEAKNIITALILYVANESPAALRNMGEVRYLIMQDQKDFQLTVKDMQRSKITSIQRMANSIAATEPKVLASVLSTAKSQTAVWDSPRLTAITSRSDFKLEDIKKEPTSFYVIIPPEYLDIYKPIVRLMMGITIATLTRTNEKPKDPTLFIIDEFPALGYMKNIESGVGYLAGYGISLWMFIQDLSQIKEDYPKWASLIANCSCRMAFGTNDFDTAKILSDMMGTATVRVAGEGKSKESGQWFGGNVSTNVSETSRPLMTPDEVMRMPNDSQAIFVQGSKPILAEKIRYYSDPAFKGKFDSW